MSCLKYYDSCAKIGEIREQPRWYVCTVINDLQHHTAWPLYYIVVNGNALCTFRQAGINIYRGLSPLIEL